MISVTSQFYPACAVSYLGARAGRIRGQYNVSHMDIQSGVIALVLLAALFGVLSARGGLRTLQSARKMTFYRLRRQREAGGWRLLGLAFLLFAIAVALPLYGLPLVYRYYPPTPTI